MRDTASEAAFTRLRGSFAFANKEGAFELTEVLREAIVRWEKVEKRWLISFDFGFTDPRALELLAALPNSRVRVPNGDDLLARKLAPKPCFHPKSLILDSKQASGKPPLGLIVGSGNLTVSGLRLSFEHATASIWTTAGSATATSQLKAAQRVAQYFEDAWKVATVLDDTLLERYRDVRARVRKARPLRDDDDDPAVRKLSKKTALGSIEKAAELAAAKHLWVETGGMNQNLGVGLPGSQVDLAKGTRVFFGLSGKEVAKNSPLGEVRFRQIGRLSDPRHLRFGDNSMDKLDLPLPGRGGWPAKYEQETIHFTRRKDGAFDLELGTRNRIQKWKKKSRERGTAYAMKKGGAAKAREYGVF
jgi:HKD family nuclease